MAKASAKKSAASESLKKSYEQFLNQIEERQDNFADRVSAARARNTRIMDQLIDGFLSGQKDALTFSKTVTGAPSDYNGNMQLAMEMLTKSQQRSMELGKTLYHEQSEMASAYAQGFKSLVGPWTESSQRFFQPFEKMTQYWATTSSK